MGNCVKSFDCDNKAYNFLALLTQLKGVKRSKEWEWEGDHIEGCMVFSPMPHQKGTRGGRGSRKYNANNRKTRTRIQADNEICWLSASGVSLPKKENKRNTYTHTYVVLWVVSWYIYMSLNMHYATQPDEG